MKPLSLNQQTSKIVRVISSISLFSGIVFFVYSAYAGTFSDGGSTQVFKGLAALLLLLVGNIVIEKIVVVTRE